MTKKVITPEIVSPGRYGIVDHHFLGFCGVEPQERVFERWSVVEVEESDMKRLVSPIYSEGVYQCLSGRVIYRDVPFHTALNQMKDC